MILQKIAFSFGVFSNFVQFNYMEQAQGIIIC